MKDEEKIREYLNKNGSLAKLFLPGASLRYTKLLAGMDLSFANLSNSDLTVSYTYFYPEFKKTNTCFLFSKSNRNNAVSRFRPSGLKQL